MIWQDALIPGGPGFLSLAFIPTVTAVIHRRATIPFSTSYTTAVVLTVIASCYATLELFRGTAGTMVTGMKWGVICMMGMRREQGMSDQSLIFFCVHDSVVFIAGNHQNNRCGLVRTGTDEVWDTACVSFAPHPVYRACQI